MKKNWMKRGRNFKKQSKKTVDSAGSKLERLKNKLDKDSTGTSH